MADKMLDVWAILLDKSLEMASRILPEKKQVLDNSFLSSSVANTLTQVLIKIINCTNTSLCA